MYHTFIASGVSADDLGVYGMASLVEMTPYNLGKRIHTYTKGMKTLSYNKESRVLSVTATKFEAMRIAQVYELEFDCGLASVGKAVERPKRKRVGSSTRKKTGGFWGKIWGLTR